MRRVKKVSTLYGRGRGRKLLIVSGGPSFKEIDFEKYKDWEIWAINASILEIPEWARRPSTFWVAGHLDTFLEAPHYKEFRKRIDKLYPKDWRLITYLAYAENKSVRSRIHKMFGFTGADFPGDQGCTFCRSLLIATRCAYERVVIAGADLKAEKGQETIYSPPFDWRPASPNRMAKHKKIIEKFAQRGLIDGSFELHPTSRWENPPFPIAKE